MSRIGAHEFIDSCVGLQPMEQPEGMGTAILGLLLGTSNLANVPQI